MIVITLLVGILFWIGIDIWAGVTSKWYKAVELDPSITSDDFSVLVPIYGNVKYLQNADYLRPCGDRVVLCTTSGESEQFYRDLEDIAIRYGFRIFRSEYVPRKVGRKRSTSGITRDTVVRDALLAAPLNSYTVCLDADTTAQEPLTHIIGALVANKADFASVTIVPQKTGPFIVQMQRHEYVVSMRARRIMPWLPTSTPTPLTRSMRGGVSESRGAAVPSDFSSSTSDSSSSTRSCGSTAASS